MNNRRRSNKFNGVNRHEIDERKELEYKELEVNDSDQDNIVFCCAQQT